MKLILTFRAGLSYLNEIEPQYDSVFEKSISKSADKKSKIHQYLNEELDTLSLSSSTITLEYDKEKNHYFSKVSFEMDREPSQEELDILIDGTSGQLTDGTNEEPWIVETSNGIVLIDAINHRKPEFLKPIAVQLVPSTSLAKNFSKLKSMFRPKKCSKKIERAVENGDLKDVKKFIENGGNVNCIGQWKQTLLMKAIQSGKENIALYLLEHNANIEDVDDEGNTALFKTGFHGLTGIAKILIHKGARVNQRGRGGMTTLMMASNRNQLDLVKFLVENGADVNLQCDNGYTALTYTTDLKVLTYLLSKNADVNLKGFDDHTAIEHFKEKLEEVKEYETEEMIKNIEAIVDALKRENT